MNVKTALCPDYEHFNTFNNMFPTVSRLAAPASEVNSSALLPVLLLHHIKLCKTFLHSVDVNVTLWYYVNSSQSVCVCRLVVKCFEQSKGREKGSIRFYVYF